ncbi:hypothetical protein BH10BAC5_BH10BAC5_01410 [soil metagenome]
MILASFAVICIILIGSENTSSILKALLLVAIVKFTLSPQTPFTAYIAVGFQGLTGYLLLRPKSFFMVKCILFGMLAMIQTSLQKPIVYTILYSAQFWNELNKMMNSLLKDFGIQDYNYALIVICCYVFIHMIAGVIAAIFAYRFTKIHFSNRRDEKTGGKMLSQSEIAEFIGKKKKKHFKAIPVILGLFAILYSMKYLTFIPDYITKAEFLQMLLRGALILLIWNYFFAPLFTSFMFKWLTKKRTVFKDELAVLLTFTPEIKEIVNKSWKDSRDMNIFSRIPHFISRSFKGFLLKEG